MNVLTVSAVAPLLQVAAFPLGSGGTLACSQKPCSMGHLDETPRRMPPLGSKAFSNSEPKSPHGSP